MSEGFKEEIDHEGMDLDITDWVIDQANEWRDYFDANYDDKFQEYYRLWRCQWAEEDKTRDSERSRLIAPATQQAVESNVAEIEEASFGKTGVLFDVENPGLENDPQIEILRNNLTEDFEIGRIRAAVGEVLINAAVYGTGVAEINIEEQMVYTPATQPMMDGALEEVGVQEQYRTIVKLNPLQPQNFLIDPTATCIEDAKGCVVEEYVSLHSVEMLQESGVYDSTVVVGTAAADDDIEADRELTTEATDRVRLTKYYGLVPRETLENHGADVESEEMYVEAIVVIANEGQLLKAIESPYMCKDRPIVAFAWDVVPSRFWGRGVCEKGYMSQKALDAEMRARIDALGLTTHPMMGVDATRVPRGASFEVRPGKMFMTNGNPQEILTPFHFGQVDQITFAQAGALQEMVQSATGAVDSAGMAGAMNGEGTAAGASMSLGAIIKRQKRTLVNFQENFMMPFVRKAAQRYMQFDPERYPVGGYKFRVISSLGVIAREYEVGQLTQLVQSLPPGTPAHTAIMSAIVEHLQVANREQVIEAINQPPEQDPEAAQLAKQKQQMEIQVLESQIAVLQGQAAEANARAQKYMVEAELAPKETVMKYSDMNNDGEMDKDFEQKMRLADLDIRYRQLEQTEKEQQTFDKEKAEAELIRQLTMQEEAGARPNDTGITEAPTG